MNSETVPAERSPRPGGLRPWLATLSPRDRAIYTLMVAILVMIAGIVLVVGLLPLLSDEPGVVQPTQPPAATDAPATAAAAAVPTALPVTPTALPTSVPTSAPTAEPTLPALFFPPTAVATNAPVAETPTEANTALPASTAAATAIATTAPTVAPTGAAPTDKPTTAPTVAPTTAATTTPATATRAEAVTLYFGDASGQLYVPTQRQLQVAGDTLALAAVQALIAGPPAGLSPLLLPETNVLGVTLDGTTAVVNLDQRPTSTGDVRGYNAAVLTLTELPGISQVQFQINGRNTGVGTSGAMARPVVNPLNPQSLPMDVDESSFLPLYFPLANGAYDVRIMRIVPKTQQTAEATLKALIDGPGQFAGAVQYVIPSGTQVRGVQIDSASRVVNVDFSREFASAGDQQAAVRTVVESLTTLPNVRGVQFFVEGQPLADFWGEAYRNGFGVPVINPES